MNTMGTIAKAFAIPASGYVEKTIGIRPTMLIGFTFGSGGVLLTYLSIQQSMSLTIFTYGLLFGIGSGFSLIQPMVVVMRWFPQNKGLVMGIVSSGYGLSALVFDPIQTAYINPDNLEIGGVYWENDEVLDRVPTLFLLLGAIYLVMQLVGLALINPSPSEED